MFMISITIAPMSKQSAFDYKILASYLLPKGILEFFDVTAVNEDHTPPCSPKRKPTKNTTNSRSVQRTTSRLWRFTSWRILNVNRKG